MLCKMTNKYHVKQDLFDFFMSYILTCAEMEINHPQIRILFPVQTAVIEETSKKRRFVIKAINK